MNEITITTKDPFDIIQRAVVKAVDLVKPTYGPASNKVIISKLTHQLVVDDGVQIMRDLELKDPSEHAVLKVIREVAIKTNDRAGDGTTGSMIMLGAIVGEVATFHRRDGHKIERELKKGLLEATEQLRAQAKPVKTLEELKKVARISFDNEEVSTLIADTWFKVGKEGVVTVDSGPTMKTTSELSEGIKLANGYISPLMVNNPERMEAVLEKPLILITDYRLTEGSDIIELLNLMAKAGKGKLLVIAENVEQSALSTLIINQAHLINPMTGKPGVMQSIAVVGPGSDNSTTLEDIALLTGATVFSQSKGNRLQNAKIEDLGQADRVIARRDGSVIIGPKGKKDVIKKAIAELTSALEAAERQSDKDKIQKRLAFFANKIAVIRVGAPTDQEQRALRYKIEDSINAVKAAFKGGVVCGGGLALSRITTSSPILNNALKAPAKQLVDNMGGIELERPLKSDEACNVITGKIGKFMDVGVIDPVDVLIAGVESAVSVASLLVTTSGMIVEKPRHLPNQ
jgi:chaperonin GroEL